MRVDITTTCMLAMMLAVLTLTACGDHQTLFDCRFDSDCVGEEYCINNQCRAECSVDDDCATGTYCGAYQRMGQSDPVQVCLSPGETAEGCTSDTECRDRFNDDDAHCGLHHRCVLSESGDQQEADDDDFDTGEDDDADEQQEAPEQDEQFRILVIEQLDASGEPVDLEDTTDLDEPDDDAQVTDALEPVRIAAVVLRNEDESLIGSGQVLQVVPGELTDGADGQLTYPLDEEGQCVEEPKAAAHTSLGGPGGHAHIELVEEDPTAIAVEPVFVEVIANSPQCPLGGFAGDEHEEFAQFRAMICTVDQPDVIDDPEDCAHRFDGPYTGFTELEVTF